MAVTDNGANFVKAFSDATEIECDDDGSGSDDGSNNDEVGSGSVDFQVIQDTLENQELELTAHSAKLPPHSRCASHTLSLVCGKDCESVTGRLHKSAFAKCHGIWNKIGRSTRVAEQVKDICGTQLVRPCATRWNSLYDSISCFLRQAEHLDLISDVATVLKFSVEELSYLKEYKMCLAPLAIALDRLQGDSFFGILIPTLRTVKAKLLGIRDGNQLKYCVNLITALLQGIESRFATYLNPKETDMKAVFAAISHPYFKLRWVPENCIARYREAFINIVCEMNKTTSSPLKTQGASSVSKDKDDDFYNFEQNTTDNSTTSVESRIRMQCHNYFEDSGFELSILNDYPAIKPVFIKYNTPIPSSAPVERLFSYGGMIFCPNRRRLSDKTFEQLLLLKANPAFLF